MELLEKCKQLSNGQSKHYFLKQTRGSNLTDVLRFLVAFEVLKTFLICCNLKMGKG